MSYSKWFFGLLLTNTLLLSSTLSGAMYLSAQEIPPPLPGDALPPPQAESQAQKIEAVNADYEVQTRGPLHEAYAEMYQANPEPGLLITKQPPKAIEEAPPNIKPEGQDVIWIPGYWAWDDENEDFLWISGIWRKPSPGHEWAPGYWAKVDDGFRWVSGFWARAGENIVYREAPPPSRDQQMILDNAADDQFWIPGSWQWQNDQYAWSDGYYAPSQQNWVWVPARWRWTPRGYIHLTGYWDFRPTVRAMLFAPIMFRPGVAQRPGFVFTPQVVVDPWIAMNHFWLRPRYSHYYFGNYYAGNYANFGFQPYANYFSVAGHWDPIFSYYQGFYRRQGIDYHARLNTSRSYYVANASLRPPLTWSAQQQFGVQHRGSAVLQTSIITSQLADFAAGSGTRFPLVTIDDRVRISLGQADSRMSRELLAHRELAERAKIDAANAGKVSDLVNWKVPKVDRAKDTRDLRMAGNKVGSAVRADLDARPSNPKAAETPPRDLTPRAKTGDSATRVDRRDTATVADAEAQRKAAAKAEMDILRQRFGNDPVRFQQEVDRLMSRRSGEPPATSMRHRSPPETEPANPLRGSGRSGGLGSPDFRVLPRSGNGGGSSAPKDEGRQPFSSNQDRGNSKVPVASGGPGAGGAAKQPMGNAEGSLRIPPTTTSTNPSKPLGNSGNAGGISSRRTGGAPATQGSSGTGAGPGGRVGPK